MVRKGFFFTPQVGGELGRLADTLGLDWHELISMLLHQYTGGFIPGVRWSASASARHIADELRELAKNCATDLGGRLREIAGKADMLGAIVRESPPPAAAARE